MKNKRGLSDIVSTTLLLLITVAAAGILMSFILPFIQKGLGDSADCLAYREVLKFDSGLGYNCYDSNNRTGVTIRANNPEKQAEMPLGFKLVFIDEEGNSVVEVKNNSATQMQIGGVRMLAVSQGFISVPRNGEAYTYVYNGDRRYGQVEVYPIAPSGKICEMTDKIDLKFCREVSLTP